MFRTNALLIVALVMTATHCALFESSANNKFSGLKAIQDIENTKFGRELLDTIAIQMQNETPLTDISSLLSSIHSDLITQQQEATKLQRKREAECEQAIKDFNRRIDNAISNIGATIKKISSLRSQITDLKTSISTFENQMVVVNDHLKLVRKDRQADAAAYKARVRNTEQTIEALDMILPKLKAIGSQTNAEVLVQLSKIGKSNPIAAFMQVASSIDKNKLGNVVEKMEELRNSLQASLEEDAQAETASKKGFKKLVADLENTYAGLGRSLAAAKSNLGQAQQSLKNEERYLVEQKEEKKSAQEGLAAKEKQCANWAKAYATTTAARTAERKVVEQVQQILAMRIKGMSDYLRNRVDH